MHAREREREFAYACVSLGSYTRRVNFPAGGVRGGTNAQAEEGGRMGDGMERRGRRMEQEDLWRVNEV